MMRRTDEEVVIRSVTLLVARDVNCFEDDEEGISGERRISGGGRGRGWMREVVREGRRRRMVVAR
jgi:hypothetical protein